MMPKERIQTRFGEVEYDPAQTLLLPEGVPGFRALRRFLVMPSAKGSPFFWIQSVEDPQVAFILTDPTQFFPDYRVVPDAGERARLGLGPDDPCYALAVVTVHPDRTATINLAAPLLFAPESNRAIQVILEGSPYSTRTPLAGRRDDCAKDCGTGSR